MTSKIRDLAQILSEINFHSILPESRSHTKNFIKPGSSQISLLHILRSATKWWLSEFLQCDLTPYPRCIYLKGNLALIPYAFVSPLWFLLFVIKRLKVPAVLVCRTENTKLFLKGNFPKMKNKRVAFDCLVVCHSVLCWNNFFHN